MKLQRSPAFGSASGFVSNDTCAILNPCISTEQTHKPRIASHKGLEEHSPTFSRYGYSRAFRPYLNVARLLECLNPVLSKCLGI